MNCAASWGWSAWPGKVERRVFPGSERLHVHLRSGWAAGQGAILTGAGAVGMGKTKAFPRQRRLPEPSLGRVMFVRTAFFSFGKQLLKSKTGRSRWNKSLSHRHLSHYSFRSMMTVVSSSRTLGGCEGQRQTETDRFGAILGETQGESQSSRVRVSGTGVVGPLNGEQREEEPHVASARSPLLPGPELWLAGAFCAHPGRPGAGKALLGRLHSLWAAACTWAGPAAGPPPEAAWRCPRRSGHPRKQVLRGSSGFARLLVWQGRGGEGVRLC